MIITFCGHSHVSNTHQVREWLHQVLDSLIYTDTIICYLGGYGEFDRLAALVVRQKQGVNSTVQSVLILPYLNSNLDTTQYDYTLFPPLESVPPRYAITKRNEWMVLQADIVIAYVTHSTGGAAKTLEYARTKKKKIIRYPETGDSAAKH